MNNTDFSVQTDIENAKINLCIHEKNDKHLIVKLSAFFAELIVPSSITVEWKIPVENIISVWSPLLGFSRAINPDWQRTRCESKTAVGSPVLSLIDNSGKNACTIAISDAKTPTEIGVGVSEEEAVFLCSATFFTSYVSPIEHYEAFIRIDFEKSSFVESVKKVNSWWEKDFGYKKAYAPKEAYLPVNCSWYSFHQKLDPEKIIEECKLSVGLGMKTFIMDDGWQTHDNNRGYCHCGDWEPATQKISSMKTLTDEIHKLGMKVMLWFSVPYVGVYSKAYDTFKDMALEEENGVLIVDLRYKAVRDYLVNIYVTAVKDYGLDGLKLDFISKFKLSEKSPAINERMDIPSIEDALDELLKQTKKELLALNPEILLEFRQSYIGPVVLKYGNMIRVSDCPYDSIKNRTEIINLRLTSGNTAVHSDAIMWNKDAPVEMVARQLIGALFGVPQISVLIKELPEQHIDAIKFWLDFYIQNTDILHSDEVYVKNPEISYSQVKTCKDGSMIGVNYANIPFELGAFQNDMSKYTLINSSDMENLCLHIVEDMGICNVKICDCLGKTISEYATKLVEGVIMLNTPMCGFIEISSCRET